jgi:hypothetical protein
MKKIILFLSYVLLNSCSGPLEEKLIGNYYLKSSPDVNNAIGVYYLDEKYYIGIVKPIVVAAGHNGDFIIIKQRPEVLVEMNKSITYYFIIPLKSKISNSVEKNVVGPLTKEEFAKKCRELKVSKDLKFTRFYGD